MTVTDGTREGASPVNGDAGEPVERALLPPGVLVARVGAGANCSSAGSAIDILFYTSVIAGAIAVALSAAFPPRAAREGGPAPPEGGGEPGDERDEQTG